MNSLGKKKKKILQSDSLKEFSYKKMKKKNILYFRNHFLLNFKTKKNFKLKKFRFSPGIIEKKKIRKL